MKGFTPLRGDTVLGASPRGGSAAQPAPLSPELIASVRVECLKLAIDPNSEGSIFEDEFDRAAKYFDWVMDAAAVDHAQASTPATGGSASGNDAANFPHFERTENDV